MGGTKLGAGAMLRRMAATVIPALVVATAAASVAPGARAEAAVAGPAVGVVGDITWGTPATDVATTVASMAASGVQWVRANVSWSGAEPDLKGTWNTGYLTQIDSAINQASAAGIKVLMPLADGVPYWASADPAKYTDASGRHWNKYWRPTKMADYADFVRTMVSRYQALGVHTFELWNEPNSAGFWPSGPSAADYATMLAAAYPAAKAADPAATVLMGGLSKNDYDYLAQLYAAGAQPYFDAVAVHPYTGSADPTWCWNQGGTTKLAKDAFCGIEEVRNTMVAGGDAAKTIWLTELGWSTTTGAYGVSEATQADYFTKAFTKAQSYPYVTAAFWYNFRNTSTLLDAPADYEANLGLLRTDFTAKPAYAALRSWTGAPPAVAPVLSNVKAANVGSRSASITWTTDKLSDSRVEYWVSTRSATASDANLTTAHSVALSGLARRTQYSYRVRSIDAAGNAAVSAVYSFTTTR